MTHRGRSFIQRDMWSHGFKALLLLLCLSLSACGGGQGEDSIRIGSGQSSSTAGTDASTDYPIFYIRRTTPDLTESNRGEDGDDDMRHLRVFSRTNADLYMRDRASSSAAEHNITARVRGSSTEIWDVKDLDVSADGKKVIFAMRGPLDEDQDDDEAPTWNIWEYDIAGDSLRRIISSNVIAEEGQDVSPHYLPDGQILFASTRQQASKAVLIQTEGRPGFEAQEESSVNGNVESAFVLHVMNADGSNLQQITFNQSHDFDASVLVDGRVLFSRWDNAAGRNGNGAIHLYTTNPNGTGTQLLYGSQSHATVADVAADGTTTYPSVHFVKSREMQNGNILSLVRPFNGTEFGGDLYIIDTKNYVENTQAVAASAGMSGPAQTKATSQSVRLVAAPSPGGRFAAAAPLWDNTNRILVAWSQCRVIDTRDSSNTPLACTSERLADTTNFVSADPIYSVWMYTPSEGTYQPIVAPVEGVMISDVTIAQPRTVPAFLPYTLDADTSIDSTLRNEGVGILDIRSVYDFDGTEYSGLNALGGIAGVSNPSNAGYANRPARFLRIEKAVSIPNNDVRNIDNNSFGASNFMREILGYVPVEPDGSVKVKVPSNVAFQISVVDTEGRRLTAFPRHNAWLSLRPGETVQCNGCHTSSTNLTAGQNGKSHGRSGSFNSVYSGASGALFAGGNSTFAASVGQTMAQARAAWSCATEQCQSITPSVHIAYADVWPNGNDPHTVPTTTRGGDFSLSYIGAQGLSTKAPTSSTCLSTWSSACRININYLENIQPIWERPLGYAGTVDGMAVTNLQCISCHNRKNPAGNDMVPAGQLELTSDASDNNNLRVTSYQELLFQDTALELNGGALQDHCIQFDTDPVSNLQVCVQFETVSPSISARNARGSRFFNKFASGGSHAGYLTEGELKLISEWVDIGAQYYNDPFKAPVN